MHQCRMLTQVQFRPVELTATLWLEMMQQAGQRGEGADRNRIGFMGSEWREQAWRRG